MCVWRQWDLSASRVLISSGVRFRYIVNYRPIFVNISSRKHEKLHRHFHHHLLHRGGMTVDSQAGLMGVVGPDYEEVAVTDDGINTGTVCVAGGVLGRIVRDGFRDLLQGFAADEFLTRHNVLHVDVLAVGFVSFLIYGAGLVGADDGFDAVDQLRGAVFGFGRHSGDVIQRQIERRAQALVQANIADVVVYHILLFFLLKSAIGTNPSFAFSSLLAVAGAGIIGPSKLGAFVKPGDCCVSGFH